MEDQDRARVAEIMRRMAQGDEAAAITLYREFGDRIRGIVARAARNQGATHLTAEDLDGMALDVCLDLFRRAGSWDPDGGALPWVWAHKRLVAIVGEYIGHYGAPLDERPEPEDPGAPPATDLGDDEALVRLGAVEPTVALLLDALDAVTSKRNADVLVLFEVQRTSGDHSPAHTVAAAHGMKPDAVRKVVQRTKAALLALAATDERYAPLAGLALVQRPRAA